jgi:hypothetical protein
MVGGGRVEEEKKEECKELNNCMVTKLTFVSCQNTTTSRGKPKQMRDSMERLYLRFRARNFAIGAN